MADTLRISGISKRVDGEYACDFVAMLLDVSSDEALTMGEAHTIKRVSGVRGGEIFEAAAAGDTDVTVALAVVVLGRHGKTVDESLFWKAKVGSVEFVLEQKQEGADDADPPTIPTLSGESSPGGGETGVPTLAVSPEENLSPIGSPV